MYYGRSSVDPGLRTPHIRRHRTPCLSCALLPFELPRSAYDDAIDDVTMLVEGCAQPHHKVFDCGYHYHEKLLILLSRRDSIHDVNLDFRPLTYTANLPHLLSLLIEFLGEILELRPHFYALICVTGQWPEIQIDIVNRILS